MCTVAQQVVKAVAWCNQIWRRGMCCQHALSRVCVWWILLIISKRARIRVQEREREREKEREREREIERERVRKRKYVAEREEREVKYAAASVSICRYFLVVHDKWKHKDINIGWWCDPCCIHGIQTVVYVPVVCVCCAELVIRYCNSFNYNVSLSFGSWRNNVVRSPVRTRKDHER